MKVPGEGGEEEGEGHDEAAHHRGQPGGLPAADRHEERRQQVRQAQVCRAHPNWKEKGENHENIALCIILSVNSEQREGQFVPPNFEIVT